MSKRIMGHLWSALDMKLSELFQADLFAGVLAGGGALALAIVSPESLLRGVSAGVTFVGVVIGAVIASAAILTVFLDQAFLRKLRAINRDPIYYLTPFLFTAVLGVVAMIFLLVLSTFSAKSPTAAVATIAAFSGLFTIWSLVSLLPCLSTLVQFIGLKVDALDVPDDIEVPRRAAR